MKLASHYRSVPKIVRIGCYLYEIDIAEPAESTANRELGHCNMLTKRISLAPYQTAHDLANTFIHECMHGMHHAYGLNDRCDEEEFTTLTANALCCFWQDNPEAARWWSKLILTDFA
jgi:hypothetical protein